MLRELITWVLNTYLGKYLEDFNPAQLSVALLSGEVELENVPLRKDALRGLGLPLQALSGSIGKIKLQIPVRQFRTAPWRIIIEQIYVVVGPKDLNDWDDEKERQSDLDYKLSQLDAAEAKWRAHIETSADNVYSSSYSSWMNYGTGLATNILENLQLKINDVHIRYEDEITIPNYKFACGVTIESLTAQTCDMNWIPSSSSSWNQDISYKLVELKSFSIYWDRLTRDKTCSDLSMPELIALLQKINADKQNNRYIINPISAQARVKRDRSLIPLRTRSRPRLSCEVFVSQINLSLSNFQFTQMVECLHGLQTVNKLQMYRVLRPSSQVSGNAKSWWEYAAKCHGFVYETNEDKWTKAKENIKYIKLYAKLLANPNENLTPEQKVFKASIEKSRDIYELRVLREVCFLQLVPSDMNLRKETGDAQGKSMLYRWFPQWWGWYGSSTPISGNELISIDEAGVNSIEDDILNALEDSVENNSLLKRDAVFGKFDFSLGSGQIFILTENYLTAEVKSMIEMHFDNLNLNIETRPRSSSHLIGLSLGSVCVKDLITPNTEFPDLIKPQQKEEQPQSFGWFPNFRNKKDSTAQAQICDNEPWFQLQYEKKPLTYNTDYRLAIKTKSLDVVYNMAVLKWFIDFFANPLQNVSARQKIEEMKLSTKMKLIRNWRSILEGDAGQQRKIWSLDIDISAPQIIFFESLTNKNTSLVLVDFGRFQLRKNDTKERVRIRRSSKSMDSISTTDKSSVIDKNEKLTEIDESEEEDAFMTPCSTPPGSEKSLSDSPTMMSAAPDFTDIVINKDTGLENAFYDKIYDKYTIDLTDLQVLVCKNKERWSFASTKGSSAMHVLDRFSISLELERRVVHTTDPEYPTLKLYGSLPKLMAHVNEHKIQALSNIVDIFREDPESAFVQDLKSPPPQLGKSPSFQFLDEVDNNTTMEDVQEPGTPQNNLVVLQFVVDHLTLEVQSRGRSITELQVTGVKAGLSKRSIETNISLSVHGLLLVDAIQSYGPDFELLVASHRHVGMDSVSGSLKQSEPCSPQSPGSPDPNQDRRPTSPQTISKAINSLQRANSASWFNLRDLDALITVEINIINADPDAEKIQIANINFNNLDIIANQETIVELIGFVKRVFPKTSSTNTAAVVPATPVKPNLQRQYTEQNSYSNPIGSVRTEITFDFHRLNVLVLRAIKRDNHFVGRKVGTFTMSEAKISATLGNEISVEGSLGGLQVLDLTPEGVSHQRILSVGKDPLTDPPDLRKDLFISLTQEVYGSSKDKIMEQRQALHFQVTKNISATVNVKVRMASVWYTHCARLVQELSWCATEFKQYLKRFARSIRDKAADMAIGLVQPSGEVLDNFVGTPAEDKRNFFSTPRKIKSKLSNAPNVKIDVILDTPVLVLPRNSNSTQVLVAHLGQITVNNEEKIIRTHHQSFDDHEIFTIDEDDFLQSERMENSHETIKKSSIYSIDVRNMNLFSLDTTNRKGFRFSALPKAEEFYSCQNDAVCILHDTAISLKLTKYSEDNFGMQSMDDFESNTLYIEGSVTQPLQISLTRAQYEQLIETVNNIFKVPPDIVPPSSETTSSQHTEQPVDIKKLEKSSGGFVPKISFTLPLFIIQLKNENENPLIELSLKEFSFQYEKISTFETSIQILLRSVLMEDLKCSIDSKYRQMVTSISESQQTENRASGFSSSTSCPDLVRLQSPGDLSTGSLPGYLDSGFDHHMQTNSRTTPLCPETPPPSPQNRAGQDNLVIYSAVIVDESCPALKSQYDNFKQRSNIEFNSLNLIISVERWFMFLDFFGLVSERSTKEDVDTTDSKEKDLVSQQGNTELDITVRSLNLVFIRNENELAKANVSNASIVVAREGNLKIVEGKLGSVSLYDLSPYGKIYKEKFLTSGTEALKFVYKKEGDTKPSRSLNKDAELKIQMSSVKYVHTKRFVLEIQAFIREYLQLQTPVMRRIKSDSPNNEQRATQLGLEISAGSPIIILPLSWESNQLIVADLGKFSLKNSFHFSSDPFVISKKTESSAPDVILDVMQVNLVNTNLFTGDRIMKNEHSSSNIDASLDMESYFVLRKSRSLFEEKSHLMVQVERNLDSGNNHSCPDISVQGTLSRLQAVVNLEQYKLIRGFLSYNLGENTNDIFIDNSFSLAESKLNLNSTLAIEKLPDKLVWNNMSINLDLEDVAVGLKWNDSPSPTERKSLACISFIKSCLKIDSFTDGSQDIDLVSQEILITDSRYTKNTTNRGNVFTKILQPIKSEGRSDYVQAEVHSRKRDDHSKYTILLNNMRIMAILDWLENMQEYLLHNAEPPTSYNSRSFDVSENVENETNNNTMEVILNITNSELVFVEKTDVLDTNAVILKSTTVFSYKPNDTVKPMSVNLNPLEVFSCILGYEDETALSIIDPITINVDLKENKIELQLQKQLCIRLSYHDVKMFNRMLQSLPKQTRTAQKKKSQKEDERDILITRLISLGFKRSDCIQALDECGNQLDEAAIWLTKSKALATNSSNKIMEIHAILINAYCISICIIDDCKDADVPLLELSMSQLEFKQELNRQVFSLSGFCAGHLKAIIASDYYNRHLSGWEPVIEPWECLSNWNYSMGHTGNSGSLLNLKVTSDKLLKFNITNTLLDLWSIVKSNWISDYYGAPSNQAVQSPTSAGFKRRTPFVPFALKNDTGEKLFFKILLTQPGGVTSTETASGNNITDWIEVTPNQVIPFAYGQKSKLRHMDSHKLNLHQILVRINGWNDVGPVSIDKVGVFFRHARETNEKFEKARVVFDISLKGSAQKLITVRSALKVVNQLDNPIILNMEPYTQNLDSKKKLIATLLSSETYHIPLSWVKSNIYFKPKTDFSLDQENGNLSPVHSRTFTANMNYQHNEHIGKSYNFTTKPVNWFARNQEDLQQMQQYCRSGNGNKNDSFNIVCVVRREGFPHRDRYPGHTITLIPPLRITNLLCCDLTYESSSNGQSQGRISSSETANIFDVSLESDIILRISLDNYKKSVPLTVPVGFIGIAEPKLRLVDIHERDLHLRASIHSIKGSGIEIFISAPFWLVNKAGLPLVFRQEGCSKDASGQFDEHEKARVVTPLMFSFSDPDASPSLEIRLGDRYGPNPPWCRSLSLYKDIIQRQLKSSNSNENFEIGVEVRRGRGRYSRTSVVTFSPRFQLYNRSSYKLQFIQKCYVGRSTDTVIDAVPGCHFPFHWPRSDLEPLLCVRLSDIQNCNWSSGIPIYEAQSLYINIRNDCGEMHFLRLEVLLQGATYFLLFGDAHSLPPPIRLDNYSEVPVNFYQELSRYRTTVKAHSSLSYALDDPMGHQFLQIEAPDGHSHSFALGNLNQAVSLTYSNFIYICFKGTFNSPSINENLYMSTDYYIESQHLVLEVLSDKRVVLARKRAGDRAQLWLMNSNGQLEHEGSSPPIEVGGKANQPRLVLDLERAPNPNDYTNLTVRPPNKQRQHTQAWRFENGRLMCAHSNMCVQARGGIFGLKPGSDAVLGRIESETRTRTNDSIPIEQCIDRQKFRPGSGHLELTMRMDGPIKAIQIRDVKYSTSEPLPPDPNWKHTSSFVINSNRRSSRNRNTIKSSFIDEFFIKLHLNKGLGVSVISRSPCEELAYISLEQISMEVIVTPLARSIDLNVGDMQIDNQLLDTQCPIFLYTMKSPYEEDKQSALVFNAKLLPSPNENAVMFERVILSMKPSVLFLEEKFILKAALFLGLGSGHNSASSLADESEYEAQQFTTKILSANAKRYYFEDLQLSSTNIRLSVVTASKLTSELSDMKKKLGLTLVKFEDAQINIDTFKDKHHFETSEIYLRAIKSHYKGQLKRQAAFILGSVDFLGNPLGFANDLSEGVTDLLLEGSVKSLVKNVTHGISNSTAKLTETISDGLGRVVLSEQDIEARQRILDVPSSNNTSSDHLVAGVKGFGFGLLGGVTSIVKCTYQGAQSEGFPGLLSGFGKGLMGTVTKPIIGVLDLASETANAVREQSKSAHRLLPERKRLPRCVSGAPGGLLPPFSYTQSKGQQYLHIINKRNYTEQLMSYEPKLCNDMRLLVSTEYIRIFSRGEDDIKMVVQYHLRDVVSCHIAQNDFEEGGNSKSSRSRKPIYYIEISSNTDTQVKRPRVKCQNQEMAEKAARHINYAKTIYDEREHTLSYDRSALE